MKMTGENFSRPRIRDSNFKLEEVRRWDGAKLDLIVVRWARYGLIDAVT
jgi:hypothetical protein